MSDILLCHELLNQSNTGDSTVLKNNISVLNPKIQVFQTPKSVKRNRNEEPEPDYDLDNDDSETNSVKRARITETEILSENNNQIPITPNTIPFIYNNDESDSDSDSDDDDPEQNIPIAQLMARNISQSRVQVAKPSNLLDTGFKTYESYYADFYNYMDTNHQIDITREPTSSGNILTINFYKKSINRYCQENNTSRLEDDALDKFHYNLADKKYYVIKSSLSWNFTSTRIIKTPSINHTKIDEKYDRKGVYHYTTKSGKKETKNKSRVKEIANKILNKKPKK